MGFCGYVFKMNDEAKSNFVVNEITLVKMQDTLETLGYSGFTKPEHIFIPEVKALVENFQKIHEKQSEIVNCSKNEISYIERPTMGGRYEEVMKIITRSEVETFVFSGSEISKVVEKLESLREPELQSLIDFCKKAEGHLLYFEP